MNHYADRLIYTLALIILVWAVADTAYHHGTRSCAPAPAASTDSPRS